MKRYPVDEEEWFLWILLGHTRDTLFRVRQHELKSLHISPMEAGVLFHVHDHMPLGPTPADISRWMFRESQSMAGLLARMQKKGLVKKVGDEKRKGGTRVILTPQGAKMYTKVSKRESILKLVSYLSSKERTQLKKYLQRIRLQGLNQLGIKDQIPVP